MNNGGKTAKAAKNDEKWQKKRWKNGESGKKTTKNGKKRWKNGESGKKRRKKAKKRWKNGETAKKLWGPPLTTKIILGAASKFFLALLMHCIHIVVPRVHI